MHRTTIIIMLMLFMLGCQPDRSMQRRLASDPVDQVLDQYVQASGGREAQERISTRIVGGTRKDVSTKGTTKSSPFTLWAHKDGRWRYDSEFESYGVDSMGSWRLDKDSVQNNSIQLRSRMVFIFVPQAILSIDEYFEMLSVGNQTVMEGRPVTTLETDSETSDEQLWFDNISGELVQIGNYWSIKDYFFIDGIQIPQLIEVNRADGRTTFEVQRVIHNQAIPESIFNRPEVAFSAT